MNNAFDSTWRESLSSPHIRDQLLGRNLFALVDALVEQ